MYVRARVCVRGCFTPLVLHGSPREGAGGLLRRAGGGGGTGRTRNSTYTPATAKLPTLDVGPPLR